ncbi:MAG: hybrid sensor histidine kinase/response regulator [Pseudomonadota bacterium]
MTDENQAGLSSTPSANDGGQTSLPAHESEQLQQRITELLAQVAELHEAGKNKDVLEDLVVRLREANQNLVIATLSAQELQAAAEASHHRQEEFLSMLAHELRNPLAPVAMAAELLGKIMGAHPQIPKLHGIITRQVNHMTRLVDDLLDASRVVTGKIELKKSALPLSQIIDSAVETSRPFIDKRNQRLSIDLPVEPVVIYGDLVRLSQVFSNLLINATKFTPEFELITVSARKLGNAVAISVKDNGMGIAPEIQPFIFDLFTQGFRALDRSQGGLGIGLALVRTIAEIHGGTATVRSAGTGFGSEFTVQLPIAAEAAANQNPSAAKVSQARYYQILVIEDNADANDTLSDLLTLEGHATSAAFDGPSGVALAKENSYDIIICDIGLPGMNGYEVVKQLRHLALKPMPCFIALSGYNQEQNRHLATEAGFDHYLVKPIAIDTLLNLLASSVPQ